MSDPVLKKTVCDICLADCGVDALVQDGRVIRVDGSPECRNGGRLCVKGYSNRDYIYRADRLRTPLRRVGERGEGRFEPVSWDEAYDEIAGHLNRFKAESGPDSVLFYAGYTKWFRTMLHRLAHSFGTLNFGTESSVCFQAMRLANILCTGCFNRADLPNTGLFLGWGYNPYFSGVFDPGLLEKRRREGMKLIVIDPKITPMSQTADVHLRIRAGTDGALALFFGQYLIEHDAIDRDYIRDHVHGFEEYAAYVRDFTAERAAAITGESVEKLRLAAEMLAQAPSFTSQIGAAPLTHHTNGVQNIRAVLALQAITGNYDRPGGMIPMEFADETVNAACEMGDEDFIQAVRPQNAKPKIGAARFPVWSECIDEAQVMDLPRQILTGEPYPIRGIFALGMNARMFPGNEELLRALKQVEFFADTDLFMTETAKYADIVLPACSSFERVQFQGGYMGHYFNPMTARCLTPAIEPLYESRSDADIVCELSVRLGLSDPLLNAGYDACSEFILRKTGLHIADLQADCAERRIVGKKPYRAGMNTAFGYRTPTGKFEIASELLRKHGVDPLPVWEDPAGAPDEQYPLLLVAGGRLPYHFHSRFQNSTLHRVFRPKNAADIHPDDAKRLGIEAGDDLRITTAQGSITLAANVTVQVPQGSIFIFQDYPGADVNSIIGADHLDPISGFPGFRSVRCRAERSLS